MYDSIETEHNNPFKLLKNRNKFLSAKNKMNKHKKEVSQIFIFKDNVMHQKRISEVSEKCYITVLLLLKVHYVIISASSKIKTVATSDRHFLLTELSNICLR